MINKKEHHPTIVTDKMLEEIDIQLTKDLLYEEGYSYASAFGTNWKNPMDIIGKNPRFSEKLSFVADVFGERWIYNYNLSQIFCSGYKDGVEALI